MNRLRFVQFLQCVLAATTLGAIGTSSAEPASEGVFQLKAQHSGKCVHQHGATMDEGGAVTQWTCVDQPNLRIEKLTAGSGYFFLRFQHSGKCLTVENEGRSNGTPIIQQSCNYAGPIGQTWKELPGDGRYVKIQSSTGLCLHQHGNTSGDGDPITGWECVDQPNVRWELVPQGPGNPQSSAPPASSVGRAQTSAATALGGSIQPSAAEQRTTGSGLSLQTQPMGSPTTGAPLEAAPKVNTSDQLRAHVATNKPFIPKRPAVMQEIQGTGADDSPNTDPTQSNAQLQSLYASAVLDETDRAELQLDSGQFTQLTSGVTADQATIQQAPSQRVLGAPGGGVASSANLQVQSTQSAYAAQRICEVHYQNQPRISRVLPARDGQLVPGELFMVKGACFGRQAGTVEIRFGGTPTPVYRAQVVDWQPTKIQLAVPKDITGVPPTNVHVVVTTAERRQTAPRTVPFWPLWERVYVGRYARNSGCFSDPSYPHVRSYCKGFRDTVPRKTEPFDMPDDCRGALCFLQLAEFGDDPALVGLRYTEEDIAIQPTTGVDRWTFDLPPYARLASVWRARYESFDSSKNGIRIDFDQVTRELLVRWHMSEMGEQGYLGYDVDGIEAWLPVGVLKP